MKVIGAAVALAVAVVIAVVVIGSAFYGAADTIRSGGVWGVVAVVAFPAVLGLLAWRDSR